MALDLDALARTFAGTKAGGKAGNLEKYKELFNTPDGKKLLSQLTADDEKSAKQAAEGDAAAARRLMTKLLTSREGMALARQVMDLYNKG